MRGCWLGMDEGNRNQGSFRSDKAKKINIDVITLLFTFINNILFENCSAYAL